jgi:general L-amino acid transport system permease protein
MSDITLDTAAAAPAAPRTPPASQIGVIAWLRANLFSSWLNSAVTLLVAYFLVRWILGFVEWGIVNAVWSVPNNQTQACRDMRGIGACWAVITEKHRFILFGTYPYEEHWRPALCVVLFVGLYIVSAMRRFWRKELALV